MVKVELVKVGDELGLPLPDDLLKRWGLTAQDTVYMSETANGFILSPRPLELDDPALP